MSLALNNNSFERTNFLATTKNNNSKGQQYKQSNGKQELSKLKEIFQLLPSDASIDSRSSVCSSSRASFDDSTSDSGFGGSVASFRGEKKRWLKVDDDLLHSDLKLFIQKYGIGFKSGNEEEPLRKCLRSNIDYKKFFQQVIACGDEDVDEINRKLKMMLVEPKNTDAALILHKHFALLCDVIAHYHADRAMVERDVFQLPPSAAVDMKIVLDESGYIFESVDRILDHLWMKMDVDAVEQFIVGMTVFCEQQGMGVENFEVSLKELILCFRVCAIDYMNETSSQNFDNFTQVMRSLASCIHSVSTRLWILSSLIKSE